MRIEQQTEQSNFWYRGVELLHKCGTRYIIKNKKIVKIAMHMHYSSILVG